MKKRFDNCFLFINCFKKEENKNLETSRKHLTKYLNELKLHFDLTENDIQKLLLQIYYSKKPENPFVKYLSMLKLWS